METTDRVQPAVSVVVLAGGSGSRLWPLSRPERPKQFLALEGGDRSMLEVTLQRALRLTTEDRILVVGDRRHAGLLRAQCGRARLLLEPVGRNTAAAVAVAAVVLEAEDPDGVMVVLSADHVIRNDDHWLEVMQVAALHAGETGDFVTIGGQIHAPETRYGYMVTSGLTRRVGSLDILGVARFVEKPDPDTLEALMASGACLRNMGMFAWRTSTLLEQTNLCMPALGVKVSKWMDQGTPTEGDAIPDWVYEGLSNVSVDEGILQRADHIAVVASSVERVDVGDYSAFASLWPVDADGNAVNGTLFASDAHNNIVFAGDADIAVIGVDDLVVVSDGQTVLICPRNRTQDIRIIAQVVQKTYASEDR